MGVLIDRVGVISTCLIERFRHGLPETAGPVDREVLFIIDGVGGFQSVPLMVRKVFREQKVSIGTVTYVWQFGLPGEIWTDLIWLKRNRVMGAKLARKLLRLKREHPEVLIYVLAFSGGTGIAVFTCESLKGRPVIETLVLAAPALSPDYDLSAALRAVQRCYTLVSKKDRVVLGAGTSVFGTMDRRFGSAAGKVGFARPAGLDVDGEAVYGRARQLRWTPALGADGHRGGHTGSVTPKFLAKHLVPLLRGAPLREMESI